MKRYKELQALKRLGSSLLRALCRWRMGYKIGRMTSPKRDIYVHELTSQYCDADAITKICERFVRKNNDRGDYRIYLQRYAPGHYKPYGLYGAYYKFPESLPGKRNPFLEYSDTGEVVGLRGRSNGQRSGMGKR